MTKFAQFDPAAPAPQPVTGWFDTDAFNYSNLPPAANLLQLTQAQWDGRMATPFVQAGTLIATPAPTASEIAAAQAKDKLAVLEQARVLRETVLNRLTGIQLNTTVAATITAIQAARTALLNITADPGVIAAIDGPTTHAAIMSAWKVIDTNLSTAAPAVASVFAGLGAI